MYFLARLACPKSQERMNGRLLACLAGLVGSIASCSLKILVWSSWHSSVLAFVVLNVVSASLFSASLRDSASLVAASISISTNLVASAVFGVTILGETVSLRSGLGVSFTVLGSALLLRGSKVTPKRE